jgi:hypothetical protein
MVRQFVCVKQEHFLNDIRFLVDIGFPARPIRRSQLDFMGWDWVRYGHKISDAARLQPVATNKLLVAD